MAEQLAIDTPVRTPHSITPEQALLRAQPRAEDGWEEHLERAELLVEHVLVDGAKRHREDAYTRLVVLLRWAESWPPASCTASA